MSPRNVVTASRAALANVVEAPPVVLPVAARPDATVREDLAVYVTNQSRFAQLKIVAIAGDEEDIALTRTVLAHHPKGVIEATNYHFSTPHGSVAKWLDLRIADGLVRGWSRDSSDLRLRCEYCELTVPNNAAGRDELSQHRLEEHAALIYGGALFGDPGIAELEEVSDGGG